MNSTIRTTATMALVVASLVWFLNFFYVANSIKVCQSLRDYSALNVFGLNCFDNPVVKQNISEIIRSWPGFTAQEHYVITEDGYQILVERSYSKITQKTPIIVVHGIGMSALGWVNRGNISMARLLGDLGYDVWMLNYRGSWYSKGHIRLKTTDPNYWKYNINDLGVYDVRSTVKMVNDITNRQAIYIGYSMGASGFFIYSSTYPEESKKYIKGVVTLAPVINYKGAKSFMRTTKYWWPYVKGLVYTLWNGEILPGFSVFLKPILATKQGIYFLQFFVNLIFGDDFEQIDPLNYPQAMTQMLDTVGAELFTHYYQIYLSEVFQNYDYGAEKNVEVYGSTNPPPYNMSKISVPISIIAGANDWLASETNAKQAYSEILPSLRCGYQVVPFEKWNHIDFLIAKDLPKYLFKHMFNKIREIDAGKCAP